MPTIKKRGYASPKQNEQEIVTIFHAVSDVLTKYRKQLTIALAVLMAAVVIGSAYAILRARQEQKASPLVAAAYELYSPSGNAAPDDQKALELFREVRNKYPHTVSGAIAQYYAGNCLANLGQPDQALKEYETFAKQYSGRKFLLGLVYQRMGFVQRSLGKQDDALKSFEKAEALTGPGAATIELARLYEAAGNLVESQKKYKEVAEKLAGTSWSMEAMGKVQKSAPAPAPAAGPGVK